MTAPSPEDLAKARELLRDLVRGMDVKQKYYHSFSIALALAEARREGAAAEREAVAVFAERGGYFTASDRDGAGEAWQIGREKGRKLAIFIREGRHNRTRGDAK